MSWLSRALALPLAAVLGAVLLASTPASAGVLDVACTPPSSNTTSYSPPLTLAAQPISFIASVQLGPCVSLSTPALTSGSYTASGTSPSYSCLDLLGSRAQSLTITWNTGQTSTMSGNRTSSIAGAVINSTFTGTVTSGLFVGDTVVQNATAPATDITLCTAGLGTVSSVYSTVTLEITSA
ncbi:hypothetical protein MF672_031050 [Actinomadura sp. ATCC 31491]|uniref:Ig-like domain-containing protein n=1 Tax=Actinomadura luzonensis TaxID=2805427 RepID=A0ABT0G0R7_9ACTN|nr:hypothetical protein [Actinomadura luzonensis]MCK2218196.1 hypothetical protein [Actinomadura luzonensis]